MDISGPVRAALHQHVTPIPAETIGDPLALYVQLVAGTNQTPVGLPRYLTDGGQSLRAMPYAGEPYARWLAHAAMIRSIPRIGRLHREPMSTVMRPLFEVVIQSAEQALLARTTRSADFLWHFYLLALARERLKLIVPDMLLKGMWRRGWAGQSRDGFLHPRDAGNETHATRDDFIALHAAYNAVLAMRELERLEPIEKLVQWHVAHTPAENPAPHSWGLAAFAALDGSDYATRYVQTAISALSPAAADASLVPLSLLADALVTQEEVSHL